MGNREGESGEEAIAKKPVMLSGVEASLLQ
jgi:hypothetical protein